MHLLDHHKYILKAILNGVSIQTFFQRNRGVALSIEHFSE